MNGEKIISKIKALKEYGVSINLYKENEKVFIYMLNENSYRIKIVIEPKKWLGLEFYLLDKNGKVQLTYDIDTDLYDISKAKYHSFAEEIEDEIVNFFDSLTDGSIKVGKIKNRIAMIIPKGKGAFLVKKGFIFTSSKYYDNIADVNLDDSFKVLQ